MESFINLIQANSLAVSASILVIAYIFIATEKTDGTIPFTFI